ncbi:hypothetical protein D3C76_890100 [compost metagenome]
MLLSIAALMILGPQVMSWLAAQFGMERFVVVIWAWLRWPTAIVLLMLVVAMIYYVTPDVRQQFYLITPGSILAVVAWLGASLAFGYYVQNFADYNAMYGGIGAIIVLLLYFYLSSAVLLIGAELNAVIEHLLTQGNDPGDKVPPEMEQAPPDRA